MKPFPFSVQVVGQMAVIAALPAIPVLLLAVPIKDIVKGFAAALL